MPHRFVRQIEPLVAHGIRELQEGVPLDHTLREIALMGALIGAGLSARGAITTVEQQEAALVGLHPAEIAEPFHAAGGLAALPFRTPVAGTLAGWPAQVGTYGKPAWAGFGKTPMGIGSDPFEVAGNITFC